MGWKEILERLIDSPIEDPFQRQQARYFNLLLLCFGIFFVVGAIYLAVCDLFIHPFEKSYSFINALVASLSVIFAFFLAKKGYFRTSVHLFLGLIILAITLTVINRGLSFTIILVYALCVVTAGLLVGTKSAFCVAFGSIASYAFAFYKLNEENRIYHPDIYDLAIFNFVALISSLMVLAIFTGLVSDGLRKQLDDMRKNRKRYKEQEARFKALFQTSTDALMILGKEKFLDCNMQTLALFGLSSKSEFVKTSPWDLSPPIQPNGESSESLAKKRIAYAFEHGHNKFEWVHRTKCGDDFPAEVWLTALELDGKQVLQATVRDISDIKMRETLLQDNVREKEVLLKELHHRVKNNLQTIYSILNLQSKQITDDEAIKLFTESQNRIKSMALIHEKLYQAKDLVNIDFREYIESLSNHLVQSYLINTERIKINIDVAEVNLGVDRAITSGLIINELMTNSFKHAFPDGGTGNVNITATSDGHTIIITVSDDGVGMKEGLNYRNTDTLGLQLVNALVTDLEAEINLLDGAGTAFEITFKE